jgi:hypothetical protein
LPFSAALLLVRPYGRAPAFSLSGMIWLPKASAVLGYRGPAAIKLANLGGSDSRLDQLTLGGIVSQTLLAGRCLLAPRSSGRP